MENRKIKTTLPWKKIYEASRKCSWRGVQGTPDLCSYFRPGIKRGNLRYSKCNRKSISDCLQDGMPDCFLELNLDKGAIKENWIRQFFGKEK